MVDRLFLDALVHAANSLPRHTAHSSQFLYHGLKLIARLESPINNQEVYDAIWDLQKRILENRVSWTTSDIFANPQPASWCGDHILCCPTNTGFSSSAALAAQTALATGINDSQYAALRAEHAHQGWMAIERGRFTGVCYMPCRENGRGIGLAGHLAALAAYPGIFHIPCWSDGNDLNEWCAGVLAFQAYGRQMQSSASFLHLWFLPEKEDICMSLQKQLQNIGVHVHA